MNAEQQPVQGMIGMNGEQKQPLLNAVIEHRPGCAHVTVNLGPGQQVKSNAGAMLFLNTDGRYVNAKVECGDAGDACYRSCAQQTCCQTVYTGPASISFGLKLPGDILPFGIAPNGGGWLFAPGSFIAGSSNCKVSAKFAGCAACCFGPAAFLVHCTSENGEAMAFCGGYGALTRHEVQAGQQLLVDQPMFFACTENTQIELALPGTVTTCLCGGEGFTFKFTGPCVVYTQNRDISTWKKVMYPPAQRQDKTQQAAQARYH